MSGAGGRSDRWRDVGSVSLAGLLLSLASGPDTARADLGLSGSIVGSWQCVAEPDPSVPEGSETFLVTFDLGSTVVTTNAFGGAARGSGTWQRTGQRRFSAREVLSGPELLGEAEYRLERGRSLSFERVLSPLGDGPHPPLRMVGTCQPLPLSSR
jgi:hypothetical protein